MSAPVVTNVDEQPLAIELAQEAAVKLRESPRTHVRNVNVSDAAVGLFPNVAPVRVHPRAVTQRTLARQRLDQNGALLVTARAQRERDLAPCEIHQQTVDRIGRRDALAADRYDDVAFAHVQAGLGERRVVFPIPRIAAIDALDAIPFARVVPSEVGAEKSALVLRRNAIVSAHFVGVRRAEFAVHLPDQVGELAARPDARQHRLVAIVDAIPIDVAHVLDPEVLGLQAPCFAVHLRPLVARSHLDVRAIQIDQTALAARFGGRFVVLGIFGQLAERVVGAQAVVRAVDQRASVRAEANFAYVRCDGRGALLFEVVRKQRSRFVLLVAVAPGALYAAHGESREVDASLDGDDVVVSALLDRKAENASFDAVEIDRDRGRFLHLLRIVAIVVVIAVQRPRFRNEGTGHVVPQRHGKRALRLRKTQVELQRVVDRVKVAAGNEVQVPAVGIPSRRAVHAQRRRHVVRLPRLDADDSQDRGLVARRPRVRDESSVGRERDVGDAPRRTLVQNAHLAVVQVHDAELVAMVGKGDCVVGWRHGEIGHATDVAGGHEARRRARIGAMDRDLLEAVDVGDGGKTFAALQPLGEPVARLATDAVMHRRAVEKRHRERLSARNERQRRSVRAGRKVLERFRGRLETPHGLRSGRVGFDRQPLRLSGGHVADAELASRPVDDAASVR